jgi:hypothetical protein
VNGGSALGSAAQRTRARRAGLDYRALGDWHGTIDVDPRTGRGVAIEEIGAGVNALCAVNESGKSTSFEAIHALLFQRHAGAPDPIRLLRAPAPTHSKISFEQELARTDRRIRRILDLLTGSDDAPRALMDDLRALEARKGQLEAELSESIDHAPLFHPNLAEIYRQKVSDLGQLLEDPTRETKPSI